MKFILVLALASLSESLNCNTLFNTNPTTLRDPDVFMMARYKKNFNRDECENCLWLVGSDFNQTFSTAVETRKREMFYKLLENKPSYVGRLALVSDFKYFPYIMESNFIDGDVCCPNGHECIARISWDGKDKLDLNGYSEYIPQSQKDDNDTSNWIYDFSQTPFIIHQRITGGTRRKFLFRQIATIAEGFGGYRTSGRGYGVGRKRLIIPKGPVGMKATEIGKSGQVSYIASVLGYIDNE